MVSESWWFKLGIMDIRGSGEKGAGAREVARSKTREAVHAYKCVYMYIHTYIHIHRYIYIHVYIYV